MPNRKRKVPSYCKHKTSGQAYVTLDGKEHYLGVYGSPESKEQYGQLIAERFPTGQITAASAVSVDPVGLTINELVLRYWTEFVQQEYVKNGKPTDRQHHIRLALRPLKELYGDLPPKLFRTKSSQSCPRQNDY